MLCILATKTKAANRLILLDSSCCNRAEAEEQGEILCICHNFPSLYKLVSLSLIAVGCHHRPFLTFQKLIVVLKSTWKSSQGLLVPFTYTTVPLHVVYTSLLMVQSLQGDCSTPITGYTFMFTSVVIILRSMQWTFKGRQISCIVYFFEFCIGSLKCSLL